MALVPEFWKRVVIFVDSQPVFPPAAASQLLWSRDVPLEIAVDLEAAAGRYQRNFGHHGDVYQPQPAPDHEASFQRQVELLPSFVPWPFSWNRKQVGASPAGM